MRITHNFKPIYNKDSRILILGSFPSVKSRENNFYYMNKYNRFWKILENFYNIPFTIYNNEEKTEVLLKLNIAIYDVIYSCDIEGSSDSSIKNVVPADIKTIIESSKIEKVYLNGNKAFELFKKYFKEYISIAKVLPSTSPANARFKLEDLLEEWKEIKITK